MTEIQVDTTQNTAHCQRAHIHQPATCRNRKGRKALCRSESVDLCGTCRKIFWCRGPDSNRQAVKRRIFFTPRLSTPLAKSFALSANVRALDYAFAIARAPSPARADRRTALGAPRLVSTPSTPRVVATRAGLARRCLGGAHAMLHAMCVRSRQGVRRI